MAINNNQDGMDIRITVDADAKTVKELKDEIGGLKNSASGSSSGVDKLSKSAKDLGKQSQQTAKDTTNLSENTKDLGKQSLLTVEHVKTLAAAFISLQAAQGVLSDLKIADDAVKTADRLGIAIEKLTALQYTAGLAGVDTASLGTSLQFLSKNAVEAAQGTGEAYDAFKRLGISIKDSNGNLKSAETLLYEIADSLGSVKSESEQVNIAMAIFGRSGAAMLNLLKTGSAGVKAGMQDAFENGGFVTEEFARKAEEANDAIEMMHIALVSVRREISAAAAPIMTEFADEIRQTANELRAFYQTAEGQEQIKALAGTAKDLVFIVSDLAKMVAWLTETFGDALPMMAKAYIALKAFGVAGSIFGTIGEGAKSVKSMSVSWDDFGKILSGNLASVETTTSSMYELGEATVNTAGTFSTLMAVAPGLFKILAGGAAIVYGTVKATGWLIDKANEWLGFAKISRRADEERIDTLKALEKQIGYTAKSADQLKNMTDGQLSAEFKTATKEANNLRQQLTAMKLAERSKEDIVEVAEKLSQVQGYIEGIRNRGVEIRGFDDLANSSKVLAEETKKANEEYAKQADAKQKVFDLSYQWLALTGQERAARQAELQYYSQATQTATNYYNSNIWAIGKQIALYKDLASTGKGTYSQVQDAAKSVAQMIVDSSNQAKSVLISNLDVLTQRAREAQSKLDEITNERKSLEESYSELVKSLRQTGMTEDQKALDNYREVQRLKEQANIALAKSIAATDAETKEKLRKQGEEYLKRERDLSFQVAQYYKSIGQYAKAKEVVTYGDEAQDRLRKLNDEAASGAKKNLDTIKSSVEYVKSVIEAIDKNIQLTISETGLDAIKRAYDELKDKTITVTTVQKSVQARRWGGPIYGRVPGYGGGDRVKALLEGGEWIHRKESVAYYGAKLMDDINNMRISPERLSAAMDAVRPRLVPDFSRFPTMEQMDRIETRSFGGTQQPRNVVELIIDIGGAKLTTTADADAYARFETIARRKQLCLPKKRTI